MLNHTSLYGTNEFIIVILTMHLEVLDFPKSMNIPLD